MSRKAIIPQADLMRIAKAAKLSGCRAEISVDGYLIAFIPADEVTEKGAHIDYGRPVL